MANSIFHRLYYWGQTSCLKKSTKARFNKSNQAGPPIFLVGVYPAEETRPYEIVQSLLICKKVGKQIGLGGSVRSRQVWTKSLRLHAKQSPLRSWYNITADEIPG